MDDDLLPDDISLAAFKDVLARYPGTVSQKVKDLDQKRLHDIPDAVAKRKKDNKLHLTRDEILTLVDWKLSHGTYRPRLKALVESNPDLEADVSSALSLDSPPTSQTIPGALKELTKLKGVGPATASLLLSTAYRDEVPFFSDELFRWMMYEGEGLKGWKRPIKYNAKEYEALREGVTKLRKRLEVSAIDAECVAYVLGKEAAEGKPARAYTDGKAAKDAKGGLKGESASEAVGKPEVGANDKGDPDEEGTQEEGRRRSKRVRTK